MGTELRPTSTSTTTARWLHPVVLPLLLQLFPVPLAGDTRLRCMQGGQGMQRGHHMHVCCLRRKYPPALASWAAAAWPMAMMDCHAAPGRLQDHILHAASNRLFCAA
jgi:hypothetical protein